MATELQIKANRKNSQKSTGPRTDEGKDAVSQNAVKHGLCASKNVIRGENQEYYNVFRDEMIADLSPVGAMENMLAARIVSLSWRLKRAEHFQNMVIDSLMDYEMVAKRTFLYNAREEAAAGNLELLLGYVINEDFANSRTLDQLLMYERRIESSLYKATAELKKMQRIRKEQNEDVSSVSHPHSDKSNQNEAATPVNESAARRNEAATHVNEDVARSDEVATPVNEAAIQSQMVKQEAREVIDERNLAEQSQSAGFQPETLSTIRQKKFGGLNPKLSKTIWENKANLL